MKIGLVDPSLFTWPYDVKLAQGLNAIGHVASIYGRAPDHVLPIDEEVYLKKHFYHLLQFRLLKKFPPKVQLLLKGLSHIESSIRLLVRFKKEKPDVIHFQWTPLALVDGKLIPRLREFASVILTVHDSNPFNNSPSSSLQRLGMSEILKKFDHLIVHTGSARDRLLQKGHSPERITVIPHGLLNEGRSGVAATPQRGDGRVRILLFGQIKPYKGVDVLLRAIALLPNDIREKLLVRVVGRPFMPMEPIYLLASELGITQSVEFDLRYVPEEEVSEIIDGADVAVFPYREIDASGVFMLALAAAKPIVASRLGMFAELLGEGACAELLIKPNDPQDLAVALGRLIVDPLYRQAQISEMQKMRSSVPSWTEIAYLTEEAYNKAIKYRLNR